MNKLQFALAKCAEEAGELTKDLMKAVIYGPHSNWDNGDTNLEKIAKEASDLVGSLGYLQQTLSELGINQEVLDENLMLERVSKNEVNLAWAVERKQVGRTPVEEFQMIAEQIGCEVEIKEDDGKTMFHINGNPLFEVSYGSNAEPS